MFALRQIQPDPCDQYIICLSNILQILAIFARCFCDDGTASCIENIADIVFCIVLGCMQTQVEPTFQSAHASEMRGTSNIGNCISLIAR
eukprot:355423-Amorphochlora_amoeboformis.AAC.2